MFPEQLCRDMLERVAPCQHVAEFLQLSVKFITLRRL